MVNRVQGINLTASGYKEETTLSKVVSCVKSTVTFPTRYVSSKTFSLPGRVLGIAKGNNPFAFSRESTGYHYAMHPLDRKTCISLLPYAAIVAASHSNDEGWLKPWKLKLQLPKDLSINVEALPGAIEKREKCFFDKESSLKALVIRSESNKVIVVFGAVESGGSELKTIAEKRAMHSYQMRLVAQNLAGIKLTIYNQAYEFFQAIKNLPEFAGCTFAACGLCFGGSLTQWVALKSQVRAYCFNSFPLGAGQQEELGDEILKSADHWITQLSVESDFVSDTTGIRTIDRALSMVGLRTPGNFGKRFVIPSAYNNMHGTHAYFMGSMLHFLNYDKRDKAEKIKEEDLTCSLIQTGSEVDQIADLFETLEIDEPAQFYKEWEEEFHLLDISQ